MKRFHHLAIIVSMLFSTVVVLWMGCERKPAGEAKVEKRNSAVIPVVVVPVAERTFQQRVSVAGNVEAKEKATVAARISGVLDAIFVEEGDSVKAGDTALFQTDSIKLTEAVEIAMRQNEVTQSAVREREANLEKVLADLVKAEMDFQRFRRLYEDHQAVTLHAYEVQESRYQQLLAGKVQAQEGVTLARKQMEQAEHHLTMAKKDLADSLVLSPMHGVVVRRMKEPGELAAAGVPVLHIEDPSLVKISCFLPGEHYGRVYVDETLMTCSLGDQMLREKVSYVSPVIHPGLRTFEVRAQTDSPLPGMVPGAMVQIEMILTERVGLAVPEACIQTRRGQAVVFTVQEDRAVEVPVRTGLTGDGYIEILDASLSKGDEVVSLGQFLLEDGKAVRIQGEK